MPPETHRQPVSSPARLYLPQSLALRYIPSMSTPTYIVTVYDKAAGARKTLLVTKDKAEAEGMVAAMEQDGVRADLEIAPKKR